MAVGGIGAIVAQAPAGALVDRSTAKRALIIGGALTITACSLAMPMFPGFYSISVLQALTGIAGSVSGNSYWLVGVQLLDGVGAGVFGALFPLVVQDVTHGSGRSTSVWEP